MKKRGGKRQGKDLSPRKTRNIKGGGPKTTTLKGSVEKSSNDTINSIIQKMA